MGRSETLTAMGRLIRDQRWAAVATLNDDATPLASQVAYALDDEAATLYLHLSKLAAHTGNLLARPAISLSITEPDDRRDDPQTLARLTLSGMVAPIEHGSQHYPLAKARYLAQLPEATQLFEFGDFGLYAFTPAEARFVGGFARAWSLDHDEIVRALSLSSRSGTKQHL